MSTRLRVAAILCAALIVSGCKSELYSNMPEREANQMVAALLENGIPAEKRRAGADAVAVMVDTQRFAEAMAILNQRGLPSATYKSLGDVFSKEGIVSSPVEERARFIYAMSQELGRTVAEIDGVLSARVHVVLPQTDMLGRDLKPSSASVFIRHDPAAPIDAFTGQIKLLIANSLEGLLYDNVTVVSVPATQSADQAPRPTEFAQVMGVWVHPASEQRLWALLSGAGGLTFVALAGMAVAGLRASGIGRRRLPLADPLEQV